MDLLFPSGWEKWPGMNEPKKQVCPVLGSNRAWLRYRPRLVVRGGGARWEATF